MDTAADFNPYAAPKAALEVPPPESHSLWRSGSLLVCRRDAEFPPRCVKCNKPSRLPLERYKLSWHHSAWSLLLLLYVVPYFLIVPLVSRRAQLHVGLCAWHARRRLLGRIATLGGFAFIMLAVYLVVAWRVDRLLPFAFLGLPAWIIAVVVLPPRFQPARIDKQMLRVKGCGDSFLDTLPEFAE